MTVGSKTATYAYDADGIRTKMVAGDVTYEFVTQDGKLMRETATNSSAVYVMDFIYDNAGRPFAVEYSRDGGSTFTTFYYVLNLQGDVVAITKADGTVVAKYTYDAWGNLTSLINANGTEIVNRTTGTAIAFWNPLTYRGYIRDRETGFYYLQSRYYDPANHRFINADSYASTGQGFVGTNMFAYCNNNPAMMTDSTGCRPIWEHDFGNGLVGYTDSVTGHYSCSDDGNYIVDQTNCGCSNWPMGVSTISDSGCGIIAAYNILLSRGGTDSFAEVYFAAIANNALADHGRSGTTLSGVLSTLVSLDPTITIVDSELSAQSMLIVYGYYKDSERTGGHAACAISNGDGTFSMYNAIGIAPDTKVDFNKYLYWFQETFSPGCKIEVVVLIG